MAICLWRNRKVSWVSIYTQNDNVNKKSRAIIRPVFYSSSSTLKNDINFLFISCRSLNKESSSSMDFEFTNSYNSSVSILLATLIFVQLLLIIYCVNLQLGFFSFTQEYYNHLYWIIPMIISIYPLLNAIIYATLYKSKNFHS